MSVTIKNMLEDIGDVSLVCAWHGAPFGGVWQRAAARAAAGWGRARRSCSRSALPVPRALRALGARRAPALPPVALRARCARLLGIFFLTILLVSLVRRVSLERLLTRARRWTRRFRCPTSLARSSPR